MRDEDCDLVFLALAPPMRGEKDREDPVKSDNIIIKPHPIEVLDLPGLGSDPAPISQIKGWYGRIFGRGRVG